MTNRDRIEGFFDNYVRLVLLDVEREIASARRGESAGNFLCALALLAYTEVLGGIKRGRMRRKEGRKNFNSFFADLGPEYRRIESLREINVRSYAWAESEIYDSSQALVVAVREYARNNPTVAARFEHRAGGLLMENDYPLVGGSHRSDVQVFMPPPRR